MGAAGVALAAPVIVPASVFGADAPSGRITLGVIGCGGKGTGGMRNLMGQGAQVVGVCDPNARNRDRAAAAAKVPASARYVDFRELLARRDLDTVLVATPDHWHVLCSIAAVRAGKDVYCEKPLSNTVAEGRALADTVRRYGAVFQHGTQLRSMRGTRHACELVRNGYIGELEKVVVGSPPGKATGHAAVEAVPDWMSFDTWLGPAPSVPYVPKRVLHPGWYFVSDYSKAGWVAGFGVHDMDIAQWALGTEHTGPVEIEGTGVFPTDGLFDTVLTYELTYTYADGRKIIVTDTGKNRHGVQFFGSEGWVFTRGGIEAKPASLLGVTFRPTETRLYVSNHHERNFLECVRTRRATLTPAEVAHRSTTICLIGGIALKLGRKLRWNPDTERFVNDAEANGLLDYPMRPPWSL